MERIVIRKSQILTFSNDEEHQWISFIETIHQYLNEGWTIIHLDDPRGDISVSLRKYPTLK